MTKFIPSRRDTAMFGPLLAETKRFEYRPQLSQERPDHPGWYDRESRIKEYPDTFTVEQRQFCMAYWHHQCCLCGSTDNMQMDHWIPVLSKAFPGTSATNMLPMCKRCNSAKHNREPRRWVRDNVFAGRFRLAQIDSYFKLVGKLDWKQKAA